MSRNEEALISPAFENSTLRISIAEIDVLRELPPAIRKSPKYLQIASSIREVGIIEPPVVFRDPIKKGSFRLLDGHLRLDILVNLGVAEVVCLVATEDEAFTYNRRISRLSIVQEHRMILEAVKRGVSEERLARALNVNISSIKQKRRLLDGICPEAVELLRDKPVPINSFVELRRLKPVRQIAAVEMMVAMNRFSITYAKALVAATPEEELVAGKQPSRRGISDERAELMKQETDRLDREFRLVEETYGSDHLDLVVASAYVSSLLENARIVRYLAQFEPQILSEFQKIVDVQRAA